MQVVDLSFEEFGSAQAEPLVILHGFFASSRNWRQVAETLSTDFHVYVIDMRNHGASPHYAHMDYPVMTADLLHFIDKHRLSSVNLLGHSMGGKIAMWFALNHPERLNKLIVADIAPVSYQHSFDDLINALKALPLAEITNRKQAELWLADAIPELSYRQFLLQNLVLTGSGYAWRVDLDIFLQAAPDITAFPETANLSPYQGQCLFLAGEHSHFIKVDAVNKLFPKAEIKVIAAAGHWLHVQQPLAFTESVAKFLR
ncbi:MAG: alpha/beta fold hydrolase [Methylococcales bacterium]